MKGLRSVLKYALKHPRLVSYLRSVYQEANSAGAEAVVSTAVPETLPFRCASSTVSAPRLNLLVPALSTKHVFGGISTALDFFAELASGFENVRIILTEEWEFTHANNPDFADWEIRRLGDPDREGRCIVPGGDRAQQKLPVGPQDRFVATAWWTAVAARGVQEWQSKHFPMEAGNLFVYLIQDYEPGFYPWSSRYALAEATYQEPDRVIAVFNTSILKRFFDEEGYRFSSAHVFEPRLNATLREARARLLGTPKERRVLVYGRPSVDRNCFGIIVEGLKALVAEDPCEGWEFVSAGEVHPPVDLGQGKALVSLGKLSLAEYANQLARASVGVSLMISPHPSYPPLEMAAFDVRVISNRYKSKNLATLVPQIESLARVDPLCVRDHLAKHVRGIPPSGHERVVPSAAWQEFLSGEGSAFGEMTGAIRRELFGGSSSRG